VAKKPKPKVTDQHVKNAQEIAQILSAMRDSGQQEEPAQQTPAVPIGVSPLGGQAK